MDGKIRLTQAVSCAGCAAKISPAFLSEAVSGIDWPRSPEVLCASEGNEDAGVVQISETEALVQTTDFFTPVVDEPYVFGQAAAANALSDLYAMGATPLSALNIVCYPEDLGPQVLKEILQGGADKAREAGCSILGGHSVRDAELKYGMAVTGKALISQIRYNRGARPGDVLILTKPLGTGILNTALKRGVLQESTKKKLLGSMTMLNAWAAECMLRFDTSACTDVTGFSLMGHAMEMAKSSGVGLQFDLTALPILPEVKEQIQVGHVTRGDKSNRVYTQGFAIVNDVSEDLQPVLFDPQTSGGLLIAVAEEDAGKLLEQIREGCEDAAIIGICLAPGLELLAGQVRVK